MRDVLAFAARSAAFPVAVALCSFASVADADDGSLLAGIRKLAERRGRLEQRNPELEKRLESATATAARITAVEDAPAQAASGPSSDRAGDQEPDPGTPPGNVEAGSLDRREQAQRIEALEGIDVSASLTGVVQQVNPAGAASEQRELRVNYRGDVAVTLPGGSVGDI